MNNDDLKHSILNEFYKLAKEPAKWSLSETLDVALCRKLDCGVLEALEMRRPYKAPVYALFANDAEVAESGFKEVVISPAKKGLVPRGWSLFGGTVQHDEVDIPAEIELLPDDFHQTCASLFAEYDDFIEHKLLTEALQSLSGKQSPKTKEVKAVPAKAPRKAPVSPPAPKQQPKKPSSVKPSRKPKGS